MFHGDTIYTKSRIMEERLTSKGDRGIVCPETVVKNQRGETVMIFRRRVLVPTRRHETPGERKLLHGR